MEIIYPTNDNELFQRIASLRSPTTFLPKVVDTIKCPACWQRYALLDIQTLQCGHQYCKECLTAYLTCQINEGKTEIVCFVTDGEQFCGQHIISKDIQTAIDVKLFEKYQRFSRQRQNPNIRECPYCTCEVMGDEKSPDITCHTCQKHFCYHHAGKHPNTNCVKFNETLRQNVALQRTQSLLKKISKPCPVCKTPTDKISGCNHMTCVCTTHWCWLCCQQIDPATHYLGNASTSCAGRQFEEELRPSTRRVLILIAICCFPLTLLHWIIVYSLSAVFTLLSIMLTFGYILFQRCRRKSTFAQIIRRQWQFWYSGVTRISSLFSLLILIAIALPLSFASCGCCFFCCGALLPEHVILPRRERVEQMV
jgi:hypothetical protein